MDMDVKLRLLIDILIKKQDVMTEIYNIVMNQKTIMTSDGDYMQLLKETSKMVKEKTTEVNDLDEKFQNEYDMISKELSETKESYKGYINVMKEKIKINTELKLKIKLQEDKNKELMMQNK